MSKKVVMLALGAVIIQLGCEKIDLGKPCGTNSPPVPEPIDGEEPTVEVVRLERDATCESFQCITQKGLGPYCTDFCALDMKSQKPRSCDEDSECTGGYFASDGPGGICIDGQCHCVRDRDCKSPLQCALDGVCRDDDCPEGFWCKPLQETGPLSEKQFCVFSDDCRNNNMCENFRAMKCNQLGCFDVCSRAYALCTATNNKECKKCHKNCTRISKLEYLCTPTDASTCTNNDCFESCTSMANSCDFHRLVCEPLEELNCGCYPPGTDQVMALENCRDQYIRCQPADVASLWEAGSLKRLNVCLPVES